MIFVGVRHLSKLRLKFNRLNEHRFRHNFDCLDPVCLCCIANEDSEHFPLHCPLYEEARRDPLVSLSDISGLGIARVDPQSLSQSMLFGNPNLTLIANRMIMEATVNYIMATKSLD